MAILISRMIDILKDWLSTLEAWQQLLVLILLAILIYLIFFTRNFISTSIYRVYGAIIGAPCECLSFGLKSEESDDVGVGQGDGLTRRFLDSSLSGNAETSIVVNSLKAEEAFG